MAKLAGKNGAGVYGIFNLINRVRWYYDDGMTQTGLAKMFNCSRTTIHNVLNCKKFAYREAS